MHEAELCPAEGQAASASVPGLSSLPSDVLHTKLQLSFKFYFSFTHLQCATPSPSHNPTRTAVLSPQHRSPRGSSLFRKAPSCQQSRWHRQPDCCRPCGCPYPASKAAGCQLTGCCAALYSSCFKQFRAVRSTGQTGLCLAALSRLFI